MNISMIINRGGTKASSPFHLDTIRKAPVSTCSRLSPCGSSKTSIGIDLGTTSSAIAVIGTDGRASVKAVVPSVVHIKTVSPCGTIR